MMTRKRPKSSAVSPDQIVELYGPDDDGWYSTKVMDWIAHCEQLKDGEVRGYSILRSLVIEKFSARVRVLTLQLLCELIPSPSGGPSSPTRVRSILDGLTRVGLVTTPEGDPLKTSSRATAATKPLRIQIHDKAPEGYTGWRNTEHKLKTLVPALAETHEKPEPSAPPAPEAPKAGRISDPLMGAGRKSDPAGWKSDPRGRKSDPNPSSDLHEVDLLLVSPVGSSLSLTPGDSNVQVVEGAEEREEAAPGDEQAEVPEQRPAPAPVETNNSDASSSEGVEVVLQAYSAALGGVSPLPSFEQELRTDAAQLLALNWPLEHVAKLAGQMPGQRYASLAKHAKFNPPPAPSAARPAERPGMCPRHSGFPEGDCSPCRIAERDRQQRGPSEPGEVDGAGLLARIRAGQPS